jgi:hypothetical protein
MLAHQNRIEINVQKEAAMPRFTRSLGLGLLMLLLLLTAPAQAEQTDITVRVLSKGAKFIGSSMGGARIMIHDARTDELLATGLTQGSTGDTQLIMRQKLVHHAPVSTEPAAAFRTSLDLDTPRKIKVTAYGPVAQPQAANTVSLTQWVVPGRDLTGGDGLMLEMPGFVVDVLAPAAHKKFNASEKQVAIEANVTMMCGCPIRPDGLWDANAFEVRAIVKRNGERLEEKPLDYAGETSQFATQINADAPGVYEITVYAYDPANGNTGLDKTSFILTGP